MSDFHQLRLAFDRGLLGNYPSWRDCPSIAATVSLGLETPSVITKEKCPGLGSGAP